MSETKVVVMRGLVGAGKSHYAAGMMETFVLDSPFKTAFKFSADDYHIKDGKYQFDPKHQGAAHAWCFKQYLTRLNCTETVDRLLIVDNTNLFAWEAAPYVQAANAYGVPCEVITLMCDPYVAWRRQTHNVPAKTFWAMYAALLQETMPPSWNHTVITQEGDHE